MTLDAPLKRDAQAWHTTVTAENIRADVCLSDVSGLSKTKVKDAMAKGAAWTTRGRHTQRLRRASRKVAVLLFASHIVIRNPPPSPML